MEEEEDPLYCEVDSLTVEAEEALTTWPRWNQDMSGVGLTAAAWHLRTSRESARTGRLPGRRLGRLSDHVLIHCTLAIILAFAGFAYIVAVFHAYTMGQN